MSNTRKLQISFSNLVKNIAKHSEIDVKMFKDVIKYINSADNQYNDKDKMIFEKNIGTDLYQIIIKTTKNKKENYLLSFDSRTPLSPAGSVGRFTVIKLSIYIISYL